MAGPDREFVLREQAEKRVGALFRIEKEAGDTLVGRMADPELPPEHDGVPRTELACVLCVRFDGVPELLELFGNPAPGSIEVHMSREHRG